MAQHHRETPNLALPRAVQVSAMWPFWINTRRHWPKRYQSRVGRRWFKDVTSAIRYAAETDGWPAVVTRRATIKVLGVELHPVSGRTIAVMAEGADGTVYRHRWAR